MSLLYSVVFATRCRSNHHRLALDALRHLEASGAEDWRRVFLHYHADYLAGAKAPDEQFKDFKNHVLHVREGEWGGAIEACAEWYKRTLRAFAAKDWRQGVWSAGVMSHYYVDPIQPFHTHQTEEENVIHRAVEQSFSKAYGEFQRILERDLGGYPQMRAPDGADWLADMVRAGAKASNVHYEMVIDHYNFDAGAKDPPAGLDQELKDVIARLVGHAAVGLARILDRSFEEAAVSPPKLGENLQAFFLTLEAPIQAVLGKIDDAKARAEVAAQYEEFRRTGKVRATLGEDDKLVRALHATEVLETPLSSLDARWPREIGAKHGEGAPARNAKKKRPTPKIAALPQAVEARPKPEKVLVQFTLDGASPIVAAPSIGVKTAKRLEAVGVRTVGDLLALSPEKGQSQIATRHISAQLIRDWQAQALLACTIPGLLSREAQALAACGVRDATELAAFKPAELAEAMGRWITSGDGARAWGEAPAPTREDVADWVARSRNGGRGAPRKKSAA
jgi:Domain of unknown function (DUF4332)